MTSHSRVNERDHDVSGPAEGLQALVVVGQAAGVHQHPALLRVGDGTVVPRNNWGVLVQLY